MRYMQTKIAVSKNSLHSCLALGSDRWHEDKFVWVMGFKQFRGSRRAYEVWHNVLNTLVMPH